MGMSTRSAGGLDYAVPHLAQLIRDIRRTAKVVDGGCMPNAEMSDLFGFTGTLCGDGRST